MEITFKQTSSCVLYCGTATRSCSQHKKAAALNFLEVSSPNRELGSRILAKLQEQRCFHMVFYIFAPYVISKVLKTKLNFTPLHLYFFSIWPVFSYCYLCTALSLLPHIFTSAPAVLSVMLLAVVCLPSLLPSSCTCSKVPCCGSEAQLQHFESLSPGSQVFGLWRECM